jgi:23S rRNA (cytosine1962-C5)-methyltransferase
MSAIPSLAVKPSRQHPFLARHPWVHAASLIDEQPSFPRGQVVDLTTHDGTWIARGLFNPDSRLRVRLYCWDRHTNLDGNFFAQRVRLSHARRLPCDLDAPDQALRVVYSEADGISGLIVDRYADVLVVQLTAAAIEPFLSPILDELQSLFSPRAIVLRTDPKLLAAEGFSVSSGVVRGTLEDNHEVLFLQNGLRWSVDPVKGQKTGAYLDQRDNHAAAAKYARGRSVLDVCCHHGGFGLVAAARGATSVLGIDASEQALQVASQNAQRNGLENVRFQLGDCFDTLAAMAAANEKFGLVVLDPPRLAGTRQNLDAAMRAYFRLNRSAIDLLPPGGILVTCSCSGRVSRADFLNNLVDVGRRAGRDITVMENRGAAPDHPLRVSCPETDYLKCLICEVQ